jgi:hypothetical protein
LAPPVQPETAINGRSRNFTLLTFLDAPTYRAVQNLNALSRAVQRNAKPNRGHGLLRSKIFELWTWHPDVPLTSKRATASDERCSNFLMLEKAAGHTR